MFHGRGKLSDKLNDVVIAGEFRSGKAHGFARITYGDKSQYEGEVANGVRHGRGVYTYPDKVSKYEGLFEEDNYHGHGELAMKDGVEYKGEFKNGAFHGRGEYLTKEFRYIGEFRHGNL